jgi:hypothetical protein
MNPKRSNFFYLLFGLLILLVLAPVGVGRFQQAVNLAYTATLVIGVWTLAKTRWAFFAGLALAVASLAVRGAELGIESQLPTLLGRIVAFAFCLLSLIIVLREVLFGDHVDANRIAGAVCVYLLLGVLWTFAYVMLHSLDPGAFSGLPADYDDAGLYLLYFSFVTLTTLGYGDISPVSHLAHALCYLEAVSGVMYVAILVASLVGSVAARPSRREPR